jgi:succinate dehydrogenase hydrophobic anchor subunit
MLAAALAHAGAGIWLLIDEQAPAARRGRFQAALAATVAVLLTVGTAAIAVAGTR